MTIGEQQYQFDNFTVEGGALQFPALGEKGPTITVVEGAFDAATKLALETLTANKLSLVTPLTINSQKVLVNTSSLLGFAKAVASGSKSVEDLTQIVKELTSNPELLGSFVLSLVANAQLTTGLEGLAGASEANKAEVQKADDRLKATTKLDLQLLKKPELSTEASAAINSALSKKLEEATVLAEEIHKLATKAVLNFFPVIGSKLLDYRFVTLVNDNPKLQDLIQQWQMIARIELNKSEKSVEDLDVEEAPKAGLSTAKKVALASAAALAAITAGVLYADPMGFFAPEPVVVEEAVEETSNAIYAVAAAGLALAGYGAVKVNNFLNELASELTGVQHIQ